MAITTVGTVLAASSWFLASQIATPDQLAAQAEPPPPSIIVADVERRGLSRTVSLQGEMVAAESIAVSLLRSDSSRATVTGSPLADGDRVYDGSVLAAVNGRPIIGLVGALAMYRDLRPGHSGPDVEQLNLALDRLGYPSETANVGEFTAQTIAGIQGLYLDLGYDPITTSESLSADRTQLVQAVSDARDALAAARAERESLLAGPDALERATADAAVDSARRAFDAAKAQQLTEERTWAEAVEAAQAALAEVEAASGSESEIAQAKQHLETVQADADNALRAAADAIADSASSLELARLSREALDSSGDSTDVDRQIGSLERQVNQSQQALSDFDQTEGVMIPMAELVFMPTDGMVITRSTIQVGTQIEPDGDEPLMVLVNDDLTFESFVSSNKVDELSVGNPVILLDDGGPPGSVEAIAAVPEVNADTGNFGFPVVVSFGTRPDVASLGEELEVDVVVESIDDTLVVPISAVYSNSDESIYVLLSTAPGHYEQVSVTVELVSDGWVAVAPSSSQSLSDGDQVVVSR